MDGWMDEHPTFTKAPLESMDSGVLRLARHRHNYMDKISLKINAIIHRNEVLYKDNGPVSCKTATSQAKGTKADLVPLASEGPINKPTTCMRYL